MASQSWSEFFEKIHRYIKSDSHSSSFISKEAVRKFFLQHFSAGVDTLVGAESFLEHTLREIYVTEGSYAHQQLKRMEVAISKKLASLIKPAAQSDKLEDVGHHSILALFDLMDKLPKKLFALSSDSIKAIHRIKYNLRYTVKRRNHNVNKEITRKKQCVHNGIRNFLVEKIIADNINTYFAAAYLRFKETKSSVALTDLLNAIELVYPIIAWDGSRGDIKPLRKAVEEMLKRKLRWELLYPKGIYSHEYIPQDSDFFNRIIKSPLFLSKLPAIDNLRISARSARTSVEHASYSADEEDDEVKTTEASLKSAVQVGSFYFSQIANIEKANEESQLSDRLNEYKVSAPTTKANCSLALTAKYPTFQNMIGFRVFNPLYIVDAVGQLVFGGLLKATCYVIDRSFLLLGKNQKSSIAKMLKLTVGMLTLAIPLQVITFALAKVTDQFTYFFLNYLRTIRSQESKVNYPVLPSVSVQNKLPREPSSPRRVSVIAPQSHAQIKQQMKSPAQTIHVRPSPTKRSNSYLGVIDEMSLDAKLKNKKNQLIPIKLANKSEEAAPLGTSRNMVHSRERNRFTFSFGHIPERVSKLSVEHTQVFEVPVTAIHRVSEPFDSGVGLGWEGDFPGTILVSNCLRLDDSPVHHTISQKR